jgi:ATP-binding cassette subfamily B multidrug efflux pump
MSKITGDVINVGLLKRVFQYIKPYKNTFIWAVVLTVLLAVVAPLRPIIIGYTLDHYIFMGDYPGLLNMTLLMLFY